MIELPSLPEHRNLHAIMRLAAYRRRAPETLLRDSQRRARLWGLCILQTETASSVPRAGFMDGSP